MNEILESIIRKWRKDSALEKVGEFEICSGMMILSDPCRDLEYQGQELIGAVKTGTWSFYIYRDDQCIHRILAILNAEGEETMNLSGSYIWDLRTYSGQMGFFDAMMYRRDRWPIGGLLWELHREVYEERSRHFFEMCCKCTESDRYAGVIPYGGVSVSKANEAGCYYGMVYRCDDRAVAVFIDFDDSPIMKWRRMETEKTDEGIQS